MKICSPTTFRPLAACVILTVASSGLSAQPSPAPVGSPAELYARAVAEYVKAAQSELSGFQGQLKALEKSPGGADLSPVKRTLESCEEIVERLAQSTQKDFDAIKRSYEQTRAELTRQLAQAKKPGTSSGK